MARYFITCFSLVLWGCRSLVANTVVTSESISIQNVASNMESFKEQKGRYPTNWTEFDQLFSLDHINQFLKTTSAYPLQRHYAFIADRVPMLGYQQGEVFLIRTEPLKALGKVGRYVISKNTDRLKFSWCSETLVQEMFSKAGAKLPTPESKLGYGTTTLLFSGKLILIIIGAIVGLGIAFIFAVRKKNKSRNG